MNEQDDKLSISSSMSISSNIPVPNDDQLTNSPSKSLSSSTSNDKYNLSNVIKHIYALKYGQKPNNSSNNNSNISASLVASAQSDTSKQFWMPDDQVKECFECNDKFTTFRRRHVLINCNIGSLIEIINLKYL
jgi:hypothetical protein